LEIIFLGAKHITNADGGVLYTIDEKKQLEFVAAEFDPLADEAIRVLERRIPLYDREGKPDLRQAVSFSLLNGITVRVSDVYQDKGFDFSWSQEFDRQAGYRTKSFLSVPLRDHEDKSIGILILVNAQDRRKESILPFSDDDQRLVETLASQAAVAMTKNKLLDDFKRLFDALTELVATAIDEKSEHTGNHCRRVPALAMMMAGGVNRTDQGLHKNTMLSNEELYELRVAALLHDCGKVTTPTHVMDKGKRLETIFDRMELVDARFEVLKRDAELAFLRKRMSVLKGEDGEAVSKIEQDIEERFLEIDADREFLRRCNQGPEFVTEDMQQRIREIAGKYRLAHGQGEAEPFLTEDEVRNLSVSRGTLTTAERQLIEYHVTATVKMLEGLPYPKSLSKVPEIVASHHERIDGRGYPKGLSGEEIPLQGRILAIADVFEALTAKGRPYKKPNTLMEALRILGFMRQEGHIDPELFQVFLREKVYMSFAEEFLDPDQMDEVVLADVPGYEDPEQSESAPSSAPPGAPTGKAA
jgi:HD-GYP domain-containing protein (c-di-GMP phosphodiesterase class II)